MTTDPSADADQTHLISVVIPVYRGERTLPGLVDELLAFTTDFVTPAGHPARIEEIFLVHDHGPDGSARVIRELAEKHAPVRPVWLSRNFGQHAATLAGMSSSGGDWIVTMDEDGQHDPAYIGSMLDRAMSERASVVYAKPTNMAPHGAFRNLGSRGSKMLIDVLVGSRAAASFHSYRLVLGEIGRSLAAYAGAGVYLDVALGWLAGNVTTTPVELRQEGDRPSGYSTRSLASHFWRMVLTSGTRLLRFVSVIGALFALIGLLTAVGLVANRIFGGALPPGWTSVMVLVLLGVGGLLLAVGIVAEYLG
ncbi:MAG: glycosyltransferase, partial [Pseudonocardia sp.]